jgi:DNA-binding NtrC family response regulator
MSKILIIEDEAAIRRVLQKNTLKKMILIRLKKPKMVLQVSKKRTTITIWFCATSNAKMDGVEVLEAVKKSNPKFYGDDFRSWRYGNGNNTRLGAFDYISKPPDLNRLLNTVQTL